MKIIDGMIWDNEIEKWVTPEEYAQEYLIEPDFDWENEVLNAR
tara:strand:+ start:540 stop:668 length:129 start_codon:yes stop_codon:yes gene_type:complete